MCTGANINFNLLLAAAQKCDLKAVLGMVQNRETMAPAYKGGLDCVCWVAWCGNLRVVQISVKTGATYDQAEKDGWTPLPSACAEGPDVCIEAVRLLTEKEATADQGGRRLEWFDRNVGYVEVVRSLELPDMDNTMPPSSVAGEIILQPTWEENSLGTNLNQVDKNGRTLLGRLAYEGFWDEATILAEYGATATQVDRDRECEPGLTAYDIARRDKLGLELQSILLDTKAHKRGLYLKEVSSQVINTASVVATLVVTLSYTTLSAPPGGWTAIDP